MHATVPSVTVAALEAALSPLALAAKSANDSGAAVGRPESVSAVTVGAAAAVVALHTDGATLALSAYQITTRKTGEQ